MKYFFISWVVFMMLLFASVPIFAYDFEVDSGLNVTGGKAGYTQTERNRTLSETIGIAIGILLGFIGVIFLGLMIYGGFTWMIARGNQAEVDKAKRMIESAVIGLIIVLAAYAITYFIGIALKQVAITK